MSATSIFEFVYGIPLSDLGTLSIDEQEVSKKDPVSGKPTKEKLCIRKAIFTFSSGTKVCVGDNRGRTSYFNEPFQPRTPINIDWGYLFKDTPLFAKAKALDSEGVEELSELVTEDWVHDPWGGTEGVKQVVIGLEVDVSNLGGYEKYDEHTAAYKVPTLNEVPEDVKREVDELSASFTSLYGVNVVPALYAFSYTSY